MNLDLVVLKVLKTKRNARNKLGLPTGSASRDCDNNRDNDNKLGLPTGSKIGGEGDNGCRLYCDDESTAIYCASLKFGMACDHQRATNNYSHTHKK